MSRGVVLAVALFCLVNCTPLYVIFGSGSPLVTNELSQRLVREAMIEPQRFRLRFVSEGPIAAHIPLCSADPLPSFIECVGNVKLLDRDAVEAALSGKPERIFFTEEGVHMHVVTHAQNLIAAIKKVVPEVAQIVFVSESDPTAVLWRYSEFFELVKLQLQLLGDDTDLPVVRLEPGTWSQSPMLFWDLSKQIATGVWQVACPSKDEDIVWTDLRDAADAALYILTRPVEATLGTHYSLVSDVAPISHFVATVSAAIAPLKLEVLSKDEYYSQLVKAALPQWYASAAARYQTYMHSLLIGLSSTDLENLLPKRKPYKLTHTIESLQNALVEIIEINRRKEAAELKRKAAAGQLLSFEELNREMAGIEVESNSE